MNIRLQRPFRCFVLVSTLCIISSCAAKADSPFGSIPGLPDLSHLPGAGAAHPTAGAGAAQGEPVVSTSLDDARVGVPFLDDYNPREAASLSDLERGPHGGFMVQPGLYEMFTESYCLNLALHAPTPGTGCLYAPMKGGDAPVVRSILQRAVAHPEVGQSQIQLLLWAVLARTKMSSLNTLLQGTAEKLMTPAEISALDKKAVVHSNPLQGLLGALPPELRSSLEAQTQLRELFTGANPELGALLSLAMAPGASTPGKGDKPVPSGRWSFHPDGYFVRYLPDSYDETQLQLYVPENFQIQRDGEGRITSLEDDAGDRIETTYDEQATAATVGGDGGVHAYAFKSIRFIHLDYLPPEVAITFKAEWNDTGWTLVGSPLGGGHPSNSTGRFTGLKSIYQSAAENKQQVELLARVSGKNGTVTGSEMDEIVTLASYRRALQAVVGKASTGAESWKGQQVDLVTRAWESAICVKLGNSPAAVTAKRSGAGTPVHLASFERLAANGTPPVAGREYDPSGDVGVPGNTSTQRLAQSGRPSPKHKTNDCERAQTFISDSRKFQDAYKDPAMLEKARKNHWTAGQYEQAIEDAWAQQAKSTGGKAPSIPAYTDPDTCKVTLVWDRNKYIKRGWPAFIYDAVVAHEEVHAKNCAERHKEGRPNSPDEDSRDEIEAYDTDIALVQKWVDDHCGPNPSRLDPGEGPPIPGTPQNPVVPPDDPATNSTATNACGFITKAEATAVLWEPAEMAPDTADGALSCSYQTAETDGQKGVLTISLVIPGSPEAANFETPPDPDDRVQRVAGLGDSALLFIDPGVPQTRGNAIRVKKGPFYFTITVKPRVGTASPATLKGLAEKVLGRVP